MPLRSSDFCYISVPLKKKKKEKLFNLFEILKFFLVAISPITEKQVATM